MAIPHFPKERWVSADGGGKPLKKQILDSIQSNSIRGRNDWLKPEEGKSLTIDQQLGPDDITPANQRK